MDLILQTSSIREFNIKAIEWLGLNIEKFKDKELDKEMYKIYDALTKQIAKSQNINNKYCYPEFSSYMEKNLVTIQERTKEILGFYKIKDKLVLGVLLCEEATYVYYGIIYFNGLNFNIYIPNKGNNLTKDLRPVIIQYKIEEQFINAKDLYEDIYENARIIPTKQLREDLIDTLDDFTSALIALCPEQQTFIEYKTNELFEKIKNL